MGTTLPEESTLSLSGHIILTTTTSWRDSSSTWFITIGYSTTTRSATWDQSSHWRREVFKQLITKNNDHVFKNTLISESGVIFSIYWNAYQNINFLADARPVCSVYGKSRSTGHDVLRPFIFALVWLPRFWITIWCLEWWSIIGTRIDSITIGVIWYGSEQKITASYILLLGNLPCPQRTYWHSSTQNMQVSVRVAMRR